MRVIVYVPSVRGAARTRRAVEHDVGAAGDQVVGHAATPEDARLATDTGYADGIVGKQTWAALGNA